MQSQENDRCPRAERSLEESLILGMAAVLKKDEWYNLTVFEAVGIAMMETGGNLNPRSTAEKFRFLVRQRGLVALEGLGTNLRTSAQNAHHTRPTKTNTKPQSTSKT